MTPAWVLHPRGVLTVAAACFVTLTAAVIGLGALPADAALRNALLSLATPTVVATMRLVNRAGSLHDSPLIDPGHRMQVLGLTVSVQKACCVGFSAEIPLVDVPCSLGRRQFRSVHGKISSSSAALTARGPVNEPMRLDGACRRCRASL